MVSLNQTEALFVPGSDAKPLISLVVPCYNESEVFPYFQTAITEIADKLEIEFRVEIILVDDGSKDSTWQLISSFAAKDSRVRGIALSRNFGQEMAFTCGFDLAQGDAVVSMDADLQDPPEVLFEMIEEWKKGYDVVDAVRTLREGESRFKLWTASNFYRFVRFLGITNVKANAGDFRLMSRQSLNALEQMREGHRFIRGMVGWVGFRSTEVFFQRKPRKAGETKFPLYRQLHIATNAIVSFSTVPLKVSFITAILLAAIILGYLCIATVKHFFFGAELAPGWTSIILATVSLGVMNLICIGILGEYVGRIYEQVKKRPLYLVRDTTRKSESSRGVTEATTCPKK